MYLTKKIFLLLITPLILVTLVTPAFAHNETMAGSKWFFGKNGIVAEIELAPSLLAQIKGIKGGYSLIETCSDERFRKVVTDVIQPYIDRKLSISVNDKVYPVRITRIDRSDDIMWKMWLSVKDVSFDNPVNPVKIDYRLFFEETDDTHINISYLYRSDAAADTVQKNGEEAEPLARNIFDVNAPVWELSIEGSTLRHTTAQKPLWATVGEFIVLGIKHILTGYDHIAFLLALIVIGLSFKDVIKIITAFTIAHSITLLLAALQIVSLNSRLVEIVIALSICYVALENLFRKEINYRWLITFGFGLIHGFGFASILQELIQEKSHLLPSVLSFNIGVEIGQILIFLVALPILYLLNRKFEFRKVCVGTSMVIFITGSTWLVERVFDLKFLPF